MKNSKTSFLIAAVIASASANVIANEHGENIIYIGGGSSKTDSNGFNSGTAATLGFIKQPTASENFFGFDISGEGTNYHNGRPEKSTSFNVILGRNLNKTENGRFDAGLLIGLRNKSSSCDRSYIGYRCYADGEESTKYGANFGGLISYTHNSLMLGIRATGKSQQLIVGFKY